MDELVKVLSPDSKNSVNSQQTADCSNQLSTRNKQQGGHLKGPAATAVQPVKAGSAQSKSGSTNLTQSAGNHIQLQVTFKGPVFVIGSKVISTIYGGNPSNSGTAVSKAKASSKARGTAQARASGNVDGRLMAAGSNGGRAGGAATSGATSGALTSSWDAEVPVFVS